MTYTFSILYKDESDEPCIFDEEFDSDVEALLYGCYACETEWDEPDIDDFEDNFIQRFHNSDNEIPYSENDIVGRLDLVNRLCYNNVICLSIISETGIIYDKNKSHPDAVKNAWKKLF